MENKDGENTCDRCGDIWRTEDLVWIGAEGFEPKKGEVLPDRVYGEYQALCEPCYLGLLT
jgi:hypothetical protein